MAATLNANGAAASGQQVAGVVKQYQLSGTGSSASSLETVTPYDSGTILGTVPPGKSGIKLVSGVVQRAAQIVADSTAGAVGNALVPTFSSLNTDPVPPSGSTAADGLSQAPEHE